MSNMPLINAGSAAEGLFWTAIVIFWIIVQILQAVVSRTKSGSRSATPKSPGPHPHPHGGPTPEDLQHFLESLGVPLEEESHPTSPTPPIPEPPVPPSRQPSTFQASGSKRQASPRPSPPAPEKPSVMAPLPTVRAPSNLFTMPLPKESLSRLAEIKIPISPVKTIPMGQIMISPNRMDLHDPLTFRRSLVSHIILSPPAAIRPPEDGAFSW